MLIICFTLTAGWAGDALKGDDVFKWIFELALPATWGSKTPPPYHWWRLAFGAISLGIAVCLAWAGLKRVEGMFQIDVKIDRGSNRKSAKMLIFIVSTISRGFSIYLNTAGKVVIRQENTSNASATELELTGNIVSDIAAISLRFPKAPFNWQQQLRGLHEHLRFSDRRLEKIVYVGSKSGLNSDGSDLQLEMMRLMMGQYLVGIDQTAERIADFSLFDELREVLRTTIKEGVAAKYAESDIVIDITGGTKTASIAGASATLEGNVQFQYVETATSSPAVYVYHIVGTGKARADL